MKHRGSQVSASSLLLSCLYDVSDLINLIPAVHGRCSALYGVLSLLLSLLFTFRVST